MKKDKKDSVLKRLLPFYKPYKGIFALDLISALIMSLAGLAFPILVRALLYDVIGADNIVWKTLLTIAGMMIGVKLIECACKYYMITVGHIMGAKIESDIRMSLFSKYMRLPTSFFDNSKVGELMARSTSDLFDITEFAHHCPEELFIIVVKILGTFIYLSTINIKLTLIIFSTLPLFIIVSYYYNKKISTVFSKNRKKIAELNSHLEDALSGIRVIKSFTAEKLEYEKFQADNDDFVDIKKESYMNMGGFNTLITAFSSLLYILTAIMGAFYIAKNEITAIDLIAYLLYISTLLQTVETIVQFTEQFQLGLSGFKRYCAVMDIPETIMDIPDARNIEQFNGQIDFVNVGFSYNDYGNKVLNDLNVTIKKGENVAIIGPSGGGKTTMVNLIPRFYETSSGSILIDGVDIKNIKLKSLRENIGIVQQDVYLFNGTIAENIAFGNPTATMTDIIDASKLAGVHEFVEKMEMGYDTCVGDRGERLSGGQKQRISIARLFLKNPPILILDEATSSLDNESERVVQQSLDRLAKGRTTLTIAHRLTTIKNAERIIVLTEKGIEEQGTHYELLAKNGIYAKLYKSYE